MRARPGAHLPVLRPPLFFRAFFPRTLISCCWYDADTRTRTAVSDKRTTRTRWEQNENEDENEGEAVGVGEGEREGGRGKIYLEEVAIKKVGVDRIEQF